MKTFLRMAEWRKLKFRRTKAEVTLWSEVSLGFKTPKVVQEFGIVCVTLWVADEQNHKKGMKQDDGGMPSSRASICSFCVRRKRAETLQSSKNHLWLPSGVHVSD